MRRAGSAGRSRTIDEAERVVVRAPNWLGDTVMALPALQALRTSAPRARITIAGRWAPLLRGQGVADVLLAYPAASRRAFNAALGRDPADIAVLLVNSFEAALSARMWRARRRIGFDTDGRRLLLTDPVPLPDPRRHQVEEYGLLLAPVGIEATLSAPVWRLDPRDERAGEAERLVAEIDGKRPSRLVGLHLGAAFGPSKLWPAESFARLADRLSAAGFVPVLLGSDADRAVASRVGEQAARRPPSLVGRDRPALLPYLLARLACLVSGDTGVAHLAAAMGVPTVTVFGPTDPRLTAPRGRAARVASNDVPCAPCFLSACPIEHPCLRGIEPDAVDRLVREAAA